MFFTFWTKPTCDVPSPPPMAAEWSEAFPTFAVFGDADVCDILTSRGASYADLFRRISIPACRADVARLAILHECGGVYVDAHAGIGNLAALTSAVENLAKYELIIFDRKDGIKSPGGVHVINSLIAARRGSEVLELVLERALRNLVDQDKMERASDVHVPYNIYVLTGPWNLASTVLDQRLPKHVVRAEFVGKVLKVDLLLPETTFPVRLYRYYGYRNPGTHWSERQTVERLFG